MLTACGSSNLASGQFKQSIMYQNQQPIGLCGHRVHKETHLQTIQMPLKNVN